MRALLRLLFIAPLVLLPASGLAQSARSPVEISGQFFLAYEVDRVGGRRTNEFALERGYITFRHRLSDRFLVRYTQDVTVDEEGDGIGDIELRLKFAFVQYSADDLGFFTRPTVQLGVVPRPWIDFEQRVNDYRLQGSMPGERDRLYRSADYGVLFATHLGGVLPDEARGDMSSEFAGKYGSFALGVFNGGGYDALENNGNKVVEGRLSLRPLPAAWPGLQVTAFGVAGKGNVAESPDYNLGGAALTLQARRMNLVLQGHAGAGTIDGSFVDENMQARRHWGWSAFGEFIVPDSPLRLVGRYDRMVEHATGDWYRRRYLAGLVWRFPNGSKVLVDMEREHRAGAASSPHFSRVEGAVEIRF